MTLLVTTRVVPKTGDRSTLVSSSTGVSRLNLNAAEQVTIDEVLNSYSRTKVNGGGQPQCLSGLVYCKPIAHCLFKGRNQTNWE